MSSRTLKMTSPAMRGSDVELFQRDLNAELERWSIGFRLDVDGVYGVETRDLARSVCFGLGLASPVMDHGATPAIRLKVRHRKLNRAEQARFDGRRQWRLRLRARLDGGEVGPRDAIAYARSKVGVTESPPGSNRGAQIDKWERACGVIAAPWCGCLANACLVAAGFPDQPWLRYCPWIEQKARSGEDGWKWIPVGGRVELGDLPLYGRSIAQHVGLVTEVEGGRDDETIEGNTSTGPGGSEDNGGIVAVRHRHADGSLGVLPIRGYARPPYSKVS